MIPLQDVTKMTRTYRTANAGDFPNELVIRLEKESDLRYGENPNQPGAIYRILNADAESNLAELTDIRLAKSGKSGLSATNFMDITRALDILKFFDRNSAAVMKHLIPSGFAMQCRAESLTEIYEKARDADARSAFGSVVVTNKAVDEKTAEAIISTFVECVASPEFSQEALEILDRKKDLRAILYSNLDKIPKFENDDIAGLYDIKGMPTGRALVQKPYLSSIKCASDLVRPFVIKNDKKYLVEREPTQQELADLITAWYVNIGVRSNGIVIVKDGVTLAVGSGRTERVGAVEQAIITAYQKAMDREGIKYNPLYGMMGMHRLSHNPLEGAVVSSDAFFPKEDSIKLLASVGVKAIIQPGGSIMDYKIIEEVNKNNMAMVYTLERCFGHF